MSGSGEQLYEWQTRSTGKQPYYFTSRDASVLAFAGL
jgi:putative SOS response-associated peptidase YedK